MIYFYDDKHDDKNAQSYSQQEFIQQRQNWRSCSLHLRVKVNMQPSSHFTTAPYQDIKLLLKSNSSCKTVFYTHMFGTHTLRYKLWGFNSWLNRTPWQPYFIVMTLWTQHWLRNNIFFKKMTTLPVKMSPKLGQQLSLLHSWLKPLASASAAWPSALCLQKHKLSDLRESHTYSVSGSRNKCTLKVVVNIKNHLQSPLLFLCFEKYYFGLAASVQRYSERTLGAWQSTVRVSVHFKLSFSQIVWSCTRAHFFQT